MKPRILFLTFKPPYPYTDGGKICTWGTIKAIVKADGQVDLLTLSYKEDRASEELIREGSKEQLRNVYVQTIDATPSLKKVGESLFSKYPDRTLRFFDKKVAGFIKEVLSTGSYDMIIFDHLSTGQYLRYLLHENIKLPVTIYRSHNIESEIWEGMQKVAQNPFLKLFLSVEVPKIRSFEKWMAKTVNYVWSLSPEDIAQYRAWNVSQDKLKLIRSPFVNIPEPIDLPSRPPQKVVLTHVGSLGWLPNEYSMQRFINDIFPALYETYGVNVILGGKRSEQFNKYEGVTGLGFVDDVKKVIASSPFFFIPVYVGSGIKIKLLEALAYQRIVITTSKGAQGFEGRHRDHILIADSVDEWKGSIEWVLNNWDKAVAMAKRGRKLVETLYSVDSVAEDMRLFFESI